MAEDQSLDQILTAFPDIPQQELLYEASKADPWLWTAMRRRLRGYALTYNSTKYLAQEIADGGVNRVATLLRHRPFLIQPLRDQHPHKVYKKGRQVGVSELSLTEVLCFLDANPNTKWIYTFPRDSQLKDFSVTRINAALTETPAMKRLVGVPNQVYTKKIGESYVILRSAWESNLGEGIDADGVTLDEKDRMKEGVDIAFRESLQSSRFGHLREVSTPTLPGRGVDEPYQKSCQYEWFMPCTKCGDKQTIKYPDNIVQLVDIPIGTKQLPPDSYDYLCRKPGCRGKIDRNVGEWVARHPSRTHIAGYHMPQTIAPWQSATKIMQKKIDYRFAQLWMNYCLAECSVGERVLLSDADFESSIAGHDWFTCRTPEWSRICVGIDWGQFNWALVIGVNAYNNKPYLIGFTVFEDDDRDPLGSARKMDAFLRPFEPDVIVADAGYGKDRNAYLLKNWEQQLYACYYNPSEKHSRTFKPQFVENSNRVLADRTIALKTACQVIKDNEIGLPVYGKQLKLLMEHMQNLAPLQIEEDGQLYEIIDKTGDDHLAHCLAYAIMGYEHITQGWNQFNCTWE